MILTFNSLFILRGKMLILFFRHYKNPTCYHSPFWSRPESIFFSPISKRWCSQWFLLYTAKYPHSKLLYVQSPWGRANHLFHPIHVYSKGCKLTDVGLLIIWNRKLILFHWTNKHIKSLDASQNQFFHQIMIVAYLFQRIRIKYMIKICVCYPNALKMTFVWRQ